MIANAFLLTLFACSERETAHLVEQTDVIQSAENSININTASQQQLQRIPFVGEKVAQRIIDHRGRYGPFRRAEHLMLIDGISDARFRQISHLLRVE